LSGALEGRNEKRIESVRIERKEGKGVNTLERTVITERREWKRREEKRGKKERMLVIIPVPLLHPQLFKLNKSTYVAVDRTSW
jgi:hypothetical protein